MKPIKKLLIDYLQNNDICRYTTEAAIRKADTAFFMYYYEDLRQYEIHFDNGEIGRFIIFNQKLVKL